MTHYTMFCVAQESPVDAQIAAYDAGFPVMGTKNPDIPGLYVCDVGLRAIDGGWAMVAAYGPPDGFVRQAPAARPERWRWLEWLAWWVCWVLLGAVLAASIAFVLARLRAIAS